MTKRSEMHVSTIGRPIHDLADRRRACAVSDLAGILCGCKTQT
jgi:hypothetical protein